MAGTNFTIGQNNSLVLNGAFITLNNGTYSNPAYLVVNSGQPSAILRNSGHIISESEGNFVKWITSDVTSTTDYTIPFGYSNSDYLPVIIHKTSVGSGAGHTDNASPIVISTWGTPSNNMAWANSVTSMTGPSGADEFNSVIDRWWQVLAGTNVSATFDVTYRGSENTTASANGIFNGQQFDIPTDQWYSAAGSGTGVTSGTGTVSNINLLTHGLNTSSPYVLSSTDSPLPVELTSFTGICNENKIQINWATASEMNVSTIELQKSYDLNSWTTIYVATPSNKNTETNYSFSYNETNNAAVYYRLQTNDIDGKTELSETIYVLPCDAKSEFLTAYSETNIIHVHSHFKNDALVNYSLYDIQGKLIATGKYNAVSGDMFFSIPLEQISSAIYIFRAESSTTMCNQKLLIKTL
jgi:hypothetical protein